MPTEPVRPLPAIDRAATTTARSASATDAAKNRRPATDAKAATARRPSAKGATTLVRRASTSASGLLVPQRRGSASASAPAAAAPVSRRGSASALAPRGAAAASDSSDAPAEPAKLQYGNIAFDTKGNQHSLAELRDRRNAAVTKGMIFMHKFFKKNNFAALHEVGDDAPSIFFECWYTSANSTIRMHAKEICKQLMPVFETRLLQLTSDSPPPTPPPAPPPPPKRRASVSKKRRSSRDLQILEVAGAPAAAQPTGSASAQGADSTVDEAAALLAAASLHEGGAHSRSPPPKSEAEEAATLDEAQDEGPAAVRRRIQVRNAAKREAAAEAAAELAPSPPPEPDGGGGGAAGGKGAAARGGRRGKEGARPDRDDFFAFMFLARCKHEMGEDDEPLLQRAEVAWQRNNFADTDQLFGVTKGGLGRVSVEDWLMLLMRVMIMEYNQLLFPGRFRLRWGMRECLTALRSVELTPPPHKGGDFNGFHHSFYLATHIVYVQSAYNAIKASEREIPWLYRYVRCSFRYWVKEFKAKQADDSVYVDLDGIAEIVDCLRGAGLTEASDPMVCEGTLMLLSTQRKNGSWPVWLQGDTRPEKEHDTYHRVHPTWVCTQCLRDRDFRIADNQFWPAFIGKALRETNFRKLLYKATW